MLHRRYTKFQTAINYTAATRSRGISKKAPFSDEAWVTGILRPTADPQTFPRPLKNPYMLVKMSQRPYTEFQIAINYAAATRLRVISKKCALFQRIPGYWNSAAHSGPANLSTPLTKPVYASGDVAKTIYGVSDCY